MSFPIPTFNECEAIVDLTPHEATELQHFVYNYEPFDRQQAKDFRDDLARVIQECIDAGQPPQAEGAKCAPAGANKEE